MAAAAALLLGMGMAGFGMAGFVIVVVVVLNLSSKALGFRSKTALRAASMSATWSLLEVLLHEVHLHLGPQVVDRAKHWQ